MSFTRFHDDPCRIAKQLEESSNIGKYRLNVPGNGAKPMYMEDPYIRLQQWGGNLRTNVVEIEESLRGINRKLNRDCLAENNYQNYQPSSSNIDYPAYGMFTEQPRAIMPAWNLRDAATRELPYLHRDPQSNPCQMIPFDNNIYSRITEVDMFNRQNNL